MCGGIGSRFWPYSRARMPKQFIDFLGTGRTLVQMCFDRIRDIIPQSNILIVTNKRYLSLAREQLPELPAEAFLLEPARRNTAPCIAWATWHIYARDPEATVMVTPADHIVTRERDFEAAIREGFDFAEDHDALLTLGITPTRPETAFGYIQIGEPETGNISRVKTFTEKPDADMARIFLSTGEFLWNSGIFIWRASAIRRALEEYVPDIAAIFDSTPLTTYLDAGREKEFIESSFPACRNISIDFSVMEKARNVYVETVTFGWSDLGTWSALYDLSPKNSDGNVTQNCNVLSYNCSGNVFAVRGEKLVAVEGLNDYIVADADGVLLICPKDHEQRIRQIVTDTKLKFGDKYE